MDPQARLRAERLALRKALPAPEAERLSRLVVSRFLKLARQEWEPETFRDKTIGLYHPDAASRELSPLSIQEDPLFQAAHLAFPRIISREKSLMDFAVPAHPTDWLTGPFGLRQPRAELLAFPPADLDLIVVPGVVFGEEGGRIGRGAGFYDRFLKFAPQALRVALAFDLQISDSVPLNPWDERVDWIVTETRSIQLDTERAP